MNRFTLIVSCLLMSATPGFSQSIEIMPGLENVFADIQIFKPLCEDRRYTIFSRTRASYDYEQETADLLTATYANFTSKSGIGASLSGRIGTRNSGSEAGLHYLRMGEKLMIFTLATIDLKKDLSYQWLAFFRYYPPLGENWKFYSSLELFFNFNEAGYNASVQRARLGLQRSTYQFGLGINLGDVNSEIIPDPEPNPGIFIRKTF